MKEKIEAFLAYNQVKDVEVVYHNGKFIYWHTHLEQYLDCLDDKGNVLPI